MTTRAAALVFSANQVDEKHLKLTFLSRLRDKRRIGKNDIVVGKE